MKKVISILAALIMLSSMVLVSNAEEQLRVTVDGNLLEFDVPPTIVKGRTLVPVRVIFENLGLTVEWDKETKTLIGEKNALKIQLPVGAKIAKRNDEEVKLDVASVIIKGRTMVPVRFIAESLDALVFWNPVDREIAILKNYEYTDGYKGQIRDGKKNGYGMTNNYTGQWKDGKYEGYGTMKYVDDITYSGQWKNHSHHGQGTYISYGEKYKGEWKGGRRNGYGVLIDKEGNKFSGQWSDDKLSKPEQDNVTSVVIESFETFITYSMNEDQKKVAWENAKKNVLEKLESPSTAKFPDATNEYLAFERHRIFEKGKLRDYYAVKGYVDAQNYFGAIVRFTFTAHVDTITSNATVTID